MVAFPAPYRTPGQAIHIRKILCWHDISVSAIVPADYTFREAVLDSNCNEGTNPMKTC